MRKKQYPAYFTVEAALILPIAMLFTGMMIFLAFYSYDRCVMEHSAYEAALRGTSAHFRTAAEAEAKVRSAAAGLAADKLFAARDFSCDILVDGQSVTVTYHCTVNMPFSTWLGTYVTGMDLSLDVSRSASRFRPARAIRDCMLLNGLLKQELK